MARWLKFGFRRFLLAVAALLAVVVVAWEASIAVPTSMALKFLETSAAVEVVVSDNHTVFQPPGGQAPLGLILYPGAGVDYRAYAPLAHGIAEAGYLVALLRMPLGLSVLDPDGADSVRQDFPALERWIVGGHSLGGVIAAQYVQKHPGVKELLLLASYPANDALRKRGTRVLSVYASEDGLATEEDIESSRALLPENTQFYRINGGNHAQFGAYGPQWRDKPAAIAPQEQWRLLVEAVLGWLAESSV